MKRWPTAWADGAHHAGRWMPAALVASLMLGVGWLLRQDAQRTQALAQEVDALSQRLADLPPQLAVPAVAETKGMANAPTPSDAPALWAALQQSLQAWGLQVLMLQPQSLSSSELAPKPAPKPASKPGSEKASENAPEKMPEQTVLLHVQGSWARWRAFEQAMAEQALWWWVPHRLVLPAGPGGDEVRLELQGRVAWRDPLIPRTQPWAWTAPQPQGPSPLEVQGQMKTAATLRSVFGAGGVPQPSPAAQAQRGRSEVSPPSSERHDARWLGTWQQGGQTHAVFASDAGPVALRAGQRLPQHHWHVLRVSNGELDVQTAPGQGPVQRWRLEEFP